MEPCPPAFHLGEPSRLQNRSWSTRFAVWRLTFHDDLLQATRFPGGIDLVCTAERARGYKPGGTLFRYLVANAGVAIPKILHSGQSQHTDMVGGKPLGLTVSWIIRRNLELHPSVPKPDYVFPDIKSLLSLLGGST